jgi:hypothetical protein
MFLPEPCYLPRTEGRPKRGPGRSCAAGLPSHHSKLRHQQQLRRPCRIPALRVRAGGTVTTVIAADSFSEVGGPPGDRRRSRCHLLQVRQLMLGLPSDRIKKRVLRALFFLILPRRARRASDSPAMPTNNMPTNKKPRRSGASLREECPNRSTLVITESGFRIGGRIVTAYRR